MGACPEAQEEGSHLAFQGPAVPPPAEGLLAVPISCREAQQEVSPWSQTPGQIEVETANVVSRALPISGPPFPHPGNGVIAAVLPACRQPWAWVPTPALDLLPWGRRQPV